MILKNTTQFILMLHKRERRMSRRGDRFPFRNVYSKSRGKVTRVRDPIQLSFAQQGQLVIAQGIPINQPALWYDQPSRERSEGDGDGEVRLQVSHEYTAQPFAETVGSIPVVDLLSSTH
ncbi:hypothetical protein PUN28_011671 [Cardiocondyla obscurior]|uniref:Uncharacterized protein n=1 Tax=Cardiocondyla obscurior TaxID=286306 RepID=A0AAW2FEZ6_9HYME